VPRRLSVRLTVLAVAAALWLPGRVQAADEPWLAAATGQAGLLLGEPQRSLFGPVLSGAVAGYRALCPGFLLGLGLRGSLFLDGDAPAGNRADPGTGGLGALELRARFRPLRQGPAVSRARGLWLELAGGAGLTGHLVRPVAEAGVGWGFGLDRVVLGPAVHYLHVFQPGAGAQGADAHAVLAGLEVILGDARPVSAPIFAPSLPPPPGPVDTDHDGILDAVDRCPTAAEDRDGFEDDDGCPDLDNDKDGIPDSADKCPNEAEVVNGVDDGDGCPDQGVIQLIDDRVVLDERLLFPTERARISPEGKHALEAVVVLWKQHPEWERMEVEGHADFRGPDGYNMWLSEERANRVRALLVTLGVPTAKLSARGFGNTRPRAEGRTPEALQQNRRVELVVIRKRPADGGAPVEPPSLQGGPRR
jgi:outer membrane protein OmpA-like peptidoglycan-associated protein